MSSNFQTNKKGKIVHASFVKDLTLCDCIMHPECVFSNSLNLVTCGICRIFLNNYIQMQEAIEQDRIRATLRMKTRDPKRKLRTLINPRLSDDNAS